MSDPYKVLGVSREADDAEVKKAYRAMSKKYHPDNNPGNKAAEEVFKQVQEAYEQIMNERKNPGSYSSYGYGASSYGQGSYGGSSYGGGYREYGGYGETSSKQDQDLNSAGVYIRNGYYDQALNVLNSMDSSDRNARWYYYSAIANMGQGNNITALEHARKAYALEPDNFEYQRLVANIENGNMYYTSRSTEYSINPVSGGNLCIRLLLCNLALNLCFGGGGMFCGSGMGPRY